MCGLDFERFKARKERRRFCLRETQRNHLIYPKVKEDFLRETQRNHLDYPKEKEDLAWRIPEGKFLDYPKVGESLFKENLKEKPIEES